MNPHDGERLLCRLIIHSSALGNYLSDKDKPNVSSDLHEVKITCADSKQASKEPQWIDMKNVLMPLLDKLLLRRRAIVR